MLGLFGLAHLYVGRRLRGLSFLGYTAVLYALTVATLLVPGFPIPLPAVWAVGWLAQEFDLHMLRLEWQRAAAFAARTPT